MSTLHSSHRAIRSATRTAILTVWTPGSIRTRQEAFRLANPRPIAMRCAEAIREFASVHGISPLAVDYEIQWGRT